MPVTFALLRVGGVRVGNLGQGITVATNVASTVGLAPGRIGTGPMNDG